ncbi:hypothetical protein ACFWUU_32845, partial [Kribbella sp. NPDC058693]|uniref:hypothetical protein n=1 Tax=Kribbella sp. NPDC058693 TaxID=3346602 RepID=UPI003661F439
MAEEESAEHYLQVIAGNARQLWQWLRGAEQRVRQLFSNQQRRRVMIEGGNSRQRWDADVDREAQGMDPRVRTQELERQADAQLREAQGLEEANSELRAQRETLQLESDAARERIREQEEALNQDRNRDGIDDLYQNRVDGDGDHIPDTDERQDEIDQQNAEADAVADEVQQRQDEQARADDERRKQQEEDRRRQDREDGLDPAAAVPAAVGAAEAAEALDDELNEERADDLDAAQQDDPATQAETDVAEQPGLDADLQQDNVDQARLLDEDGVLRDT